MVGVQLGIKLREIEKKHPQDVQHCKIEVLDWWYRNAPEISRKKLAEALKAMEMNGLTLDVQNVLNVLHDPEVDFADADWELLGHQLMKGSALKTIRADRDGNPNLCMIDTVSRWLKTDLEASWERLCDAIAQLEAYGGKTANTVRQKAGIGNSYTVQVNGSSLHPEPQSSSPISNGHCHSGEAEGENIYDDALTRSPFQGCKGVVSIYEPDLEHETCKLRSKFNVLFTKVRRSLEHQGVKVDDFVSFLEGVPACTAGEQSLFAAEFPRLYQKLTLTSVFGVVRNYTSWFNYSFISDIIDIYCENNTSIRKTLKEFQQQLREYCKHRVCRCSLRNGFGLRRQKACAHMVLKIDKVWRTIRVKQLEEVKYNLAQILEVEPYSLYLLSVENGCVQLTFIVSDILVAAIFPLSPEQEAQLVEIRVILLHCGDYQFLHPPLGLSVATPSYNLTAQLISCTELLLSSNEHVLELFHTGDGEMLSAALNLWVRYFFHPKGSAESLSVWRVHTSKAVSSEELGLTHADTPDKEQKQAKRPGPYKEDKQAKKPGPVKEEKQTKRPHPDKEERQTKRPRFKRKQKMATPFLRMQSKEMGKQDSTVSARAPMTQSALEQYPPSTFCCSGIVKRGYLRENMTGILLERKRWYVLREDHVEGYCVLEYYEEEKSAAKGKVCKGFINICDVVEVRTMADKKQMFEIVCPSVSQKLIANSESEADGWTNTLRELSLYWRKATYRTQPFVRPYAMPSPPYCSLRLPTPSFYSHSATDLSHPSEYVSSPSFHIIKPSVQQLLQMEVDPILPFQLTSSNSSSVSTSSISDSDSESKTRFRVRMKEAENLTVSGPADVLSEKGILLQSVPTVPLTPPTHWRTCPPPHSKSWTNPQSSYDRPRMYSYFPPNPPRWIVTQNHALHHKRRSLPILHSSEQTNLLLGVHHGHAEDTGKISSKEGRRVVGSVDRRKLKDLV